MSDDTLSRALAAMEAAPTDPDRRLEAFQQAARAGGLGDAIDTWIRARGTTPDKDPDPALLQAVATLGHGLGEPRNFPGLSAILALTLARPSGRIAGIRDSREVVVADPPGYLPRRLALLPPCRDAFGAEAETSPSDLRLSPDGRRLLVGLWGVTEEDLAEDAPEVAKMQALFLLDAESGAVLRHLPSSRTREVLLVARDATRVLLGPDLRLLDLESGEESLPWSEATGPHHWAAAAAPGPGPEEASVLLLRREDADLPPDERDPRLVVVDLSRPGQAPRVSERAPGPAPLVEDVAGGAPWLWFPTDHARRFECAPWRPGEVEAERFGFSGDPGVALLMGEGLFALGSRLLAPATGELAGVLPFSPDDADAFHVDPTRPFPCASGGRLQVVHPRTGALLAWRDRHREPLSHLALDPLGRLWSRSNADGEERTWDLGSGTVVDARQRAYAPGTVHPELFAQVAAGSRADTWAYRLIRRADGSCQATGAVPGGWDPPRAATISPAGDRLLLLSHTGRAVLVQAESSQEIWRHPQVGVHGAIGGFHPDGSRLVYAFPRGSDTQVRVVEPTSGELLLESPQGPDLRDMRCLLSSPNPDRWLLTHDGGTRLLDLRDDGPGESFPGPAAFVPGSPWLVFADGDGVLQLRDEAGEELGRVDPGFGRFGALAIGPGLELLASSRHYIRRLGWPEDWPVPGEA